MLKSIKQFDADRKLDWVPERLKTVQVILTIGLSLLPNQKSHSACELFYASYKNCLVYL